MSFFQTWSLRKRFGLGLGVGPTRHTMGMHTHTVPVEVHPSSAFLERFSNVEVEGKSKK